MMYWLHECIFVIIQPNVHLKWVNFTIFKLYLNKIDLKIDTVKHLDEQYFEINLVFAFMSVTWENCS